MFAKFRLACARFLAAAMSIVLITPSAFAADRFWAGNYTDNSRWENIANWSTTFNGNGGAAIPTAADVVYFTTGTGSKTVRIRSAVSVLGWVMSSTWTGSILQGTGTIIVGSSGMKIGSGRLIGGNASFRVNGNWTQTGGVVSGMMNTLTLTGSLSLTQGISTKQSAFTSTGTITLVGKADQSFTVGSGVDETFQNLTLTLPTGGSADDVAVSVADALRLSGALVINSGNLDFTTNSAPLQVERGITLADDAQATLATNSNVAASGTVLINDSATLTVTAGTWTLDDNSDQSVDFDGQSLYNLTVRNSGGGSSDDVTVSGGDLEIANDLVVTSGNLTMVAGLDVNDDVTIADSAQAEITLGGNASVAGDWTKYTAGGFNHNNFEVTLDGSGQTMSGSTTFYRLTKEVTSADTLTLAATALQTITDRLTLRGAASNLLTLASSISGVQWKLLSQGSRTISYAAVKDSNNTGVEVNCQDCNDNQGNTNWIFRTTSTSTTTNTSNTSGGGGGGGGGGARKAVVSGPTPRPEILKPAAPVLAPGQSTAELRKALREERKQKRLERKQKRLERRKAMGL